MEAVLASPPLTAPGSSEAIKRLTMMPSASPIPVSSGGKGPSREARPNETPGSASISLRPTVKSAARRWKRLHEQCMMGKLVEIRLQKKESDKIDRENARKLARRIPVELLAKDWLKENQADVDIRAYLVDKVLPILILGCEKLLTEVNKKGLAEKEEVEPNFNPINFLAKYLMRNNPMYSNFSEASPYVRGLREVSEQLRKELFKIEDNRLARVKADVKRRQEERAKREELKQAERKRRLDAFMKQFVDWTDDVDGQLELTLVQSALRSFTEVISSYPDDLRSAAQFSQSLDPTDETGVKVNIKEFSKYLEQFTSDLPTDIFDHFLNHLVRCAAAYRDAVNQEERRIILTNLFNSCDHSGIGLLDRHRVLQLFEQFWDGAKESYKSKLQNPRRWPVVEVEEAEEVDSEEEFEASMETQENDKNIEKSAKTTDSSTTTQASVETSAVNHGENKTVQLTTGYNLPSRNDSESEQTVEKTVAMFDDTQESVDHTSRENAEGIGGENNVTEENSDNSKSISRDTTKQDNEGTMGETENVEPNTDDTVAEIEPRTGDTVVESETDEQTVQPTTDEQTVEPTTEEQTVEPKTDDSTAETTTDEQTVEPKTDDSTVETTVDEQIVKPKTDDETVELTTDEQTTEPKTDDATVEPLVDDQETVDKDEQETVDKTDDVENGEMQTVTEETTDDKDERNVDIEYGIPSQGKNVDMGESGEKMGDTSAGSDGKTETETEVKAESSETTPPAKPTSSGSDGQVSGNIIPGGADDGGDDEGTKPSHSNTGPGSVSFAEGTVYERERTGLSLTSRSQSQASAFDEFSLNVSQFVLLIETFLNQRPSKEVFEFLMKFIKDQYVETEEEKLKRLLKARQEAISAKRKLMINNLFEKWDNDGSGYLDQDEVETVMLKYKEGQESEAIHRSHDRLKQQLQYVDVRLSKREFRTMLEMIVEEMPGPDSFDNFVEFLTNSVERSFAERIRGEARKKWLQLIVTAGETGGSSMEPVYREVFQALYKDAESHGGGKRISANIAMLEKNTSQPGRGDVALRYVACTPEDADFVLGKTLYKDMPGVSFAAVETGKPIHVPRVSNHGNIQFWDSERKVKEGSFIVVPLKDRRKRVFGLMGIDTLSDPHSKAIFITHEIHFFQGIAKAFSIAYHHVDIRKKLLRITESAISWIYRRSPHMNEITMYLVEPDGKEIDYILRKMMTTDQKGSPHSFEPPPKLERKDNLFRDYLFKCVDNSETVSADAYGERHLAIPLRNELGRAVAVVDIGIGELKKLPTHENREVQRMLKLLQMAHREITKELAGEEKTMVLEVEKDEDTRVDVMFDRLMLMELRENVSKLDSRSYSELRSYNEPPRVVQDILKAVLSIFYLQQAEEGEFDDWTNVKSYINSDLSQKISEYDPTASEVLIPAEKVMDLLKDVPHGAVTKHGSVPAQHMYNWVFVCLSLIEHTRKMRENSQGNILDNGDNAEAEGEGEEEPDKEECGQKVEATPTE